MVVKGNYRALGGASTATARDATFNTTDRCDGTLTEVGKGRVSLKVKGKTKPVVVRGGRAYLVKPSCSRPARDAARQKGMRPDGQVKLCADASTSSCRSTWRTSAPCRCAHAAIKYIGIRDMAPTVRR